MQNILTALLVITCTCDLQSQRFQVIQKMFDSSDVVLTGLIILTDCKQKEAGVFDCAYTLCIDHIYKGIIPNDAYKDELPVPGKPGRKSDYLLLNHTCFPAKAKSNNGLQNRQTPDNCFEKGQPYIAFLTTYQDSSTVPGTPSQIHYRLTDDWIGLLPEHPVLLNMIKGWSLNSQY